MIDKKKLKEEYKNVIPEKGIFAIKNNKNGRVFLGSSLNLNGIFPKYKFMLNMGDYRFNEELQKDWKKYGEDAFSYQILEKLELKEDINYNYDEDLKILEMLWIEKFQPFSENCYNKNEKIRTV
jgi:hypothetical protein